MIDLFSRQVVGWSLRGGVQSIGTTDALRMAWFRRLPKPGLGLYTDRGSRLKFKESSQHQLVELQIDGWAFNTSAGVFHPVSCETCS